MRARDITSAIKATRKAFAGGRQTNVPVYPDDGFNEQHKDAWLVAYFGVAGGAPPAWLLTAIEKDKMTIRLCYHKAKREPETADIHQYCSWVPLGRLEPGVYTLELF